MLRVLKRHFHEDNPLTQMLHLLTQIVHFYIYSRFNVFFMYIKVKILSLLCCKKAMFFISLHKIINFTNTWKHLQTTFFWR